MTNPVHSLNTTPITAITSDNRGSQDPVFTSQLEGSATSSPSYTPPGTPPLPIANPSSLGRQSLEGRLVSVFPPSQLESTHPSTSSSSSTHDALSVWQRMGSFFRKATKKPTYAD